MNLTSHLPPADRERVESRLRSNLIAWLTVGHSGGEWPGQRCPAKIRSLGRAGR
jgi:hypothetical protein